MPNCPHRITNHYRLPLTQIIYVANNFLRKFPLSTLFSQSKNKIWKNSKLRKDVRKNSIRVTLLSDHIRSKYDFGFIIDLTLLTAGIFGGANSFLIFFNTSSLIFTSSSVQVSWRVSCSLGFLELTLATRGLSLIKHSITSVMYALLQCSSRFVSPHRTACNRDSQHETEKWVVMKINPTTENEVE